MKIDINLLIQAFLLFSVILIIFLVILLILNEFVSPFKDCKDKSDDYVVNIGKQNITCGELKTINETIMSNEVAI